jgi:hypothetical protein
MCTIDRAAIARRQLATLEDIDEQIEVMLLGELGLELLELLPTLISDQRCYFRTDWSSHSPAFFQEGEHSSPCLILHIRRKNSPPGASCFSVDFSGLLAQCGDTGKASELVKLMIGGRSHEWTPADALAVRRHYPVWSKRAEIERTTIFHYLSSTHGLMQEEVLCPEGTPYDLMRLPAQERLFETRDYLVKVGCKRQEIENEALHILQNKRDGLMSLDKVLALASLVESNEGQITLRKTMTQMTPDLLHLHFKSSRQVVQSGHLQKLMKFSDYFKNARTFMVPEILEVLIEQLSHGKIQTVLQFFNELAPTKRVGTNHLLSRSADRTIALMPDAYMHAMEGKRFGVAAALAQLPNSGIHHKDARDALELAILHEQPIALEWVHQLIV